MHDSKSETKNKDNSRSFRKLLTTFSLSYLLLGSGKTAEATTTKNLDITSPPPPSIKIPSLPTI